MRAISWRMITVEPSPNVWSYTRLTVWTDLWTGRDLRISTIGATTTTQSIYFNSNSWRQMWWDQGHLIRDRGALSSSTRGYLQMFVHFVCFYLYCVVIINFFLSASYVCKLQTWTWWTMWRSMLLYGPFSPGWFVEINGDNGAGGAPNQITYSWEFLLSLQPSASNPDIFSPQRLTCVMAQCPVLISLFPDLHWEHLITTASSFCPPISPFVNTWSALWRQSSAGQKKASANHKLALSAQTGLFFMMIVMIWLRWCLPTYLSV